MLSVVAAEHAHDHESVRESARATLSRLIAAPDGINPTGHSTDEPSEGQSTHVKVLITPGASLLRCSLA